jgi:hypothetical protein
MAKTKSAAAQLVKKKKKTLRSMLQRQRGARMAFGEYRWRGDLAQTRKGRGAG